MKNVLKKSEYPKDVWEIITDEYEMHCDEHRRGSTFYRVGRITINEDLVKEYPEELQPYPELIGTFLTNMFYFDTEWGPVDDGINTLTRAIKVSRTVTVEEWIEVK